MGLNVFDAPTSGKRVAVRSIYNPTTERMESVIQERANDGWNFIGVIDWKRSTGGISLGDAMLLFVKDKA